MFKKEIIKLLSKQINLKPSEIENLIEIPPNPEMGDYAFPCFVLAKPKTDDMWKNVEKDFFKKKNPSEIAQHLVDKIKPTKIIELIKATGPYVNFFINKIEFAKEIIKIKNNYGKAKQSGRIMIEFSQPNTHKAFHVGHIRGTSLGESLSRINEFLGKKVIRANYSGDTGMHIAKWIWCYLKYHSKEKPKNDEEWIASIYVDAVKKLTKNEKLQTQVNEINKKLEQKTDKKINELWKKTRILSIKSWDRIYNELGTRFDRHYFESELEASGKKISQELLKKGIAKMSEEAVIMDLEKHNLGIWVLLRKDGTVLYSSKEIALAKHKLRDQNLDEFLIISGDEQNFYFKQLFKTLELMKLSNRDKFKHLGFGMVRLPHGKMSSRTGDNILYSNFRKGVTDFAKKSIKKKWSKLKNKELEDRALKIAIGSMKYAMLSQDPNKPIIFDKEKALRFEGDTGPYLQYTYARASSIIRKCKSKKSNIKIPELKKSEINLIKKISLFPEIVERAGKTMNPSIIANYSHELAQSFNEFYHNCKVIGCDCEGFRIKLVDVFRTTLRNSLYLLGIEVMEEM
jgi:arginyl-tRNA synthetase